MGDSPRASRVILAASVSTHVTRCPRYARQAPVTVPTYPVPITVTRIPNTLPVLRTGGLSYSFTGARSVPGRASHTGIFVVFATIRGTMQTILVIDDDES